MRRVSAFEERGRQLRVGSTSPAVPDAAVQPRWSLSRRLPPRATAVTGFGSPRRWRRTSSSEVERPLAKKRGGGLLSAAAATPQRSSSDSSQSEAVVASGVSTESSWPFSEVREGPLLNGGASGHQALDHVSAATPKAAPDSHPSTARRAAPWRSLPRRDRRAKCETSISLPSACLIETLQALALILDGLALCIGLRRLGRCRIGPAWR